jgi:hypothetical protein
MTSVPATYLEIPNSLANKQFLPYVEPASERNVRQSMRKSPGLLIITV